jgi:peptide/nickel transport system permease protein
MSLVSYITRRLLAMIPVVFGVLILSFLLARLMPGDPVTALLRAEGNMRFDQEIYEQRMHQLGLDQPLPIQFIKYISDLFSGRWGISVSIAQDQPVWNLIKQKSPRTIDLAIFSIVIASFLGIKTGVISATNRNKPKDTAFRGLALIGVAIPVFFLGMLLQYILGYKLDILPATGYKTPGNLEPQTITGFYIIDGLLTGKIHLIYDYLYHLILPVFCLSFITLAGIVRQTRSSMLEILQKDFIRTARAKGCKEEDVVNTHALKNSLIPTVTVIGLNFAGLLSGTVITEITFGLKGIGQLFINSIRLLDYWVLQALVFLIAMIFVFATLITDLLYAYLDPRIRY